MQWCPLVSRDQSAAAIFIVSTIFSVPVQFYNLKVSNGFLIRGACSNPQHARHVSNCALFLCFYVVLTLRNASNGCPLKKGAAWKAITIRDVLLKQKAKAYHGHRTSWKQRRPGKALAAVWKLRNEQAARFVSIALATPWKVPKAGYVEFRMNACKLRTGGSAISFGWSACCRVTG